MARSTTIYAIALCSPSGLELERIAVREAAEEVNKVLVGEGVGVEVKGWDTDVRPSIGGDAQDVVNRQIILEADIGIVIVGDRIGSATPRAPSGTVEEARSFVERKKAGHNVELMLFFKKTLVSYDADTIARISAVADFRAEMQSSGVFWKEFKSPKELAELIRLHLPGTIRSFSPVSGVHSTTEFENAMVVAEFSNSVLSELAEEIEDGALENEIEFADSLAAISAATTSLGEAAADASQIMTPVVERLSALGKAEVRDPRAMKAVIDELSLALENYGDIVGRESRVIEDNADIAIEATIRSIGFAGGLEIKGDPADLNNLADVIDQTQASMWSMAASTEGSAEAMAALPRMTKNLNAAKKKVVRESTALKEIVARFSERLSEASQAARERAHQLSND